MPRSCLVADVIYSLRRIVAELASQVNQREQYFENSFCLQSLVYVAKFIAERGLALRDKENVGSPRNFFHKNVKTFFKKYFEKKEDAMFLVTGFATVSQIANRCQISCCIITFVTLQQQLTT